MLGRLTVVLGVGAAACGHPAPPAGAIVFQVSAVHPTAADTAGPPFAAADSVIAQGPDTIIVRHARIVLAELAIAPAIANECEEEQGENNPPCVEFSDPPVAMTLQLGRTARWGAEPAPATDYNLFQAYVHRADTTTDRDLVVDNPDLVGASIRVEGVFSRGGKHHPFIYLSPWNEQQEITLEPALSVAAGDSLHVTLRVDVASWFRSADGTRLVDPVSALAGGANENLVKDNVRQSLRVFRDADMNGLEDAPVR